MKFAIIVTASAANSYSALRFAEAAVSLQHTIAAIFFYQQGVNIANPFISLAADEINLQQQWQQFAQVNLLPLIVCSASALKHGVALDKLAVPFTIGSLGQLTEIIAEADRTITFK